MMFNSLKSSITTTFGDVSKIRHCKMLSDQIFEVTNYRISESTLWRIFVEKGSVYRPHEYTLDILSFYLGFKDFSDFTYHQQEQKAKLNPNLLLLDLCLEDHHVGTVTKFLKKLPADLSYDYNETIEIAGVIGNAVVNDDQLRKKLLPQLASFEQGRIYFTDMFVDEQNFDLYYKQNLHLYLKENVGTPEKNANDQMFALNLLFKHALFQNDFKHVNVFSKSLRALDTNAFVKREKIHVFPYFRYQNFVLVQKYLEGSLTAISFVDEMIRLCESSLHLHQHTYLFRKITAEYLVYFKFYKEARQLLEIAQKEHTFSNCILKDIDELLLNVPADSI